jgi:hypothetical protein
MTCQAHPVKVSSHLRSGGAVLTFPPAASSLTCGLPRRAGLLEDWTDSVEVFVRIAPETAVVPVLVRGVVWDMAARHPLLALKRTREEKEKLASALQVLAMLMLGIKPVTVTVQIGQPVRAADLGTTDSRTLHELS